MSFATSHDLWRSGNKSAARSVDIKHMHRPMTWKTVTYTKDKCSETKAPRPNENIIRHRKDETDLGQSH